MAKFFFDMNIWELNYQYYLVLSEIRNLELQAKKLEPPFIESQLSYIIINIRLKEIELEMIQQEMLKRNWFYRLCRWLERTFI